MRLRQAALWLRKLFYDELLRGTDCGLPSIVPVVDQVAELALMNACLASETDVLVLPPTLVGKELPEPSLVAPQLGDKESAPQNTFFRRPVATVNNCFQDREKRLPGRDHLGKLQRHNQEPTEPCAPRSEERKVEVDSNDLGKGVVVDLHAGVVTIKTYGPNQIFCSLPEGLCGQSPLVANLIHVTPKAPYRVIRQS